jgi:dihydropteroate synthase
MINNNTKIVGILNITPDSFSDGGVNFNLDNALENAQLMIENDVDVIDLGAQSTRPHAPILSFNNEWERLKPVLTKLKTLTLGSKTKISIDTYNYQTAEKALELGIDWINDVSGCIDKRIINLVVKYGVKIILMHNLGIPADPQITIDNKKDLINTIKDWAQNKLIELKNHGISEQNIIFDPGIGFGKTADQSLSIIKNIQNFKDIGLEILVGHSRKSFINILRDIPPQQRDIETYIISSYLSLNGVKYIRVHDFIGNQRAINAAQQLF